MARPASRGPGASGGRQVVRAQDCERGLDQRYAAIHVDGPRAAEVDVQFDVVFTDRDEAWSVWLRRGVLNARRGEVAFKCEPFVCGYLTRQRAPASRKPLHLHASESAKLVSFIPFGDWIDEIA